HTDAGGIEDGVGDRGWGQNNARLPDSFGPEGAIPIVRFQKMYLDRGDVEMGQMPGPIIADGEGLAARRVVQQVFVQRLPNALNHRPSDLIRAVCGLIMRPDSWTATYFVIRVVPRRVSTSTSTKCAPKHWRMVPSGTGLGVAEATRTSLPVGIPRAAICCCKSFTASTTAIPLIILLLLPHSPTQPSQR